MLSAALIGLRGLQILLSIVVLGLAATLINAQVYGKPPTTISYSSFTGALGIIVGVIGVAGLFLTSIPEIAVIVLDGLLGVFFLAGGIAYAVGLKGTSCTDRSVENVDSTGTNPLISEGQTTYPNGIPGYGIEQGLNSLEDLPELTVRVLGRCKQVLSDEIIQFVLFALAIGFLVLGFLRMRKGSGGPPNHAV